MTPFDGQPTNRRAFCSNLVNQINSSLQQIPTEISKVQFTYHYLGPGALVKMRSLFQCLENPSIPRETVTSSDFLLSLKQKC